MNQAEYTAVSRGPSQEDKILKCLEAHRGDWVSMITLWSISGSMACHSRISALRKKGHGISNRTQRQPDGTIHSFYMLT